MTAQLKIHNNTDKDVTINRLLLFSGAFLMPFFGYLLLWLNPLLVEPMIDRYALSSLMFLFFTLSYISKKIKNNLSGILTMFYFLVSADMLFLLYMNQFRMEYFVGVITAFLVIVSAGFRNKHELSGFLLFFNGCLLAVLLLLGNLPFSSVYTFTSIAIISSIIWFVGSSKMEFQRKMEETEAVWRSIFENSSDHIITVNKSLEITYINFVVPGLERDKVIGTTITNFLPGDEAAEANRTILETISTGKSGSYTSSTLNNQGEKFWFLSTTNPLIVKGEIIGASVIAKDITGQKIAQESIEKSEAKYRGLFESSQDAIMIGIPPTWNFITSNPAALKMFGASSVEEFTSKGPADISPQYQPDGQTSEIKAREAIGRAMKKGSYSFEWTHKRLNGEEFPATIVLTKTIVNEQVVIQATVRDITEQKLSEERQKRAYEILQEFTSVMDSSNSISKSDRDGVITYANENFCLDTGYSQDELIGQTHQILSSGHHPKEFFVNLWETIESGKTWTGEIKNKRKDGSPLWHKKSIVPVFGEFGDNKGFISICIDITKHLELEQQLRKAKDNAEQTAQAKSNFLTTMSHEIRTPMNAVIGMTGLLMETELTEEQLGYVETIKIGGDNLLDVINDILDYSKIESGKMELDEQTFDIVETIEDVLDLTASKAMQKEIELMYTLDTSAARIVTCDTARLRQVLVNLINNAIKFTEKGEVIVSLAVEGKISDGLLLKFSVKDTGIGIPKNKMNILFESFSQVDASTTRKYGGTGLGLAISKKIVALMGGTIGVESEEGKGSCFWFTIKVKLPEEQILTRVVHSDKVNAKVLIVDDNLTNLKILESQCRQLGLSTDTTTNPNEAFAWIKQGHHYDLAILDMQMPEMDGIQLTKSIRKIHDVDTLPIIMLTSLGLLPSKEDRAMLNAHVTKPVRQTQLFKIIRNQLNTRKNSVTKNIKADVIENDPKPELNSLRILLAEDNVVNQKVAISILKKLGYQADISANGIEVLDALSYKHYDLIFMDVQMPEMDGLEASEKITKLFQKKEQKPVIIGMTAHATKEYQDKCFTAGMHDYLPKPVKFQTIDGVIKKWFPKTS